MCFADNFYIAGLAVAPEEPEGVPGADLSFLSAAGYGGVRFSSRPFYDLSPSNSAQDAVQRRYPGPPMIAPRSRYGAVWCRALWMTRPG